MIKQILALLGTAMFTTTALASPVETVVIADFETNSAAVAKAVPANSSSPTDTFSAFAYEQETGSRRLKMTDPGGFRNGIVVTIPNAFTEPGFYLITSDVKVASTAAGPISTFGMAAKVGQPNNIRVSDVNAGYVMNLVDNPTNGATFGYQTIGAGIEVLSAPADLTLYFSTDPSGAPGDARGDFEGSHRGTGASWPTATNTSAVFIDNIKRVGPGNFGEERHAWISIGDSLTNLATLESYILQSWQNGFNCIDVLARYRANNYYVKNRDYADFQHNEPAAGGVNPSNDPIQYAIDRGHELGMRVYASFSTFLVTDGTNFYPSAMPSGSVTYMYNGGNPIPQTTANDSEGLWADVGRADVRAHTINVLKDLVQNYDLDGVIFDRIRYQGDQFGYNPQALLDMGYAPGVIPAPTNAEFRRRRQQAVTTFLHDAYAAVTEIKPWMIVGTVPIAYGTGMSDTYNRVYQSWPQWTAAPTPNRVVTFGAQDLIQPQFYRQWDSGGANNAPGANRILMTKALYGDQAVDPMDYGLMPGANTNVAPLFYILRPLSDATDAANTAAAIADNICDTQTAAYPMNGSGVFSARGLFDPSISFGTSMISRIRSHVTPCGDAMSPPVPLADFLMKEGWDNTPPLGVSGVTMNNQQFFVTLNWTPPAPAEDGESAERYLIYRSTVSNVRQTYANLANKGQVVTGTSFTDGPFPSTGSYYYRVVPVDDYNNKGPSTVVGPVSVVSSNVIVESNTPAGAKTAAPTYTESTAMAFTTSKSSAPGLTGDGARYSTVVNLVATFRPNLPTQGLYNVYVTLDDAVSGPSNNALTEYTITGSGTPVVGQVRLRANTPGLANQWLLLAADVPFAAGTNGTIAFRNIDGNSGSARFTMDAVRFELTGSSVTDWQIY